MRSHLSLLASAALLFVSPLAMAQEPTAFELQAREIYQTAVEIRTAKGQSKVPELVDYLVSELKAGGFADSDILVTAHESGGEQVQGLMVWYRAEGTASEKPIVLLAHMDVVDALPDTWVRYPFELIEEDGYFFGRGTADNKAQHTINMAALRAVIEARGALGFNAKYLIEMGEEAGSAGLTELVEAHRRGIRVITELVVNHTSDQHPWFQRARRSPPGSRLGGL